MIKEASLKKMPRHIAIIMDGNGRWARARGLPRLAGHRAGAEAVRKITTACAELGVEYLTLYAFSVENWKRPQKEIKGLMRYLRSYLRNELQLMQDNNIRLLAIGRLEGLPAAVQKTLHQTMEATSKNTGLKLILALNYGGRMEIVDGVKRVLEEGIAGRLTPGMIDESIFSRYLYTRDIPDPDLLIRTSGEMRVSNFLLWEISYTEIVVIPTLWPDFDREHLIAVIKEYEERERRFGGL